MMYQCFSGPAGGSWRGSGLLSFWAYLHPRRALPLGMFGAGSSEFFLAPRASQPLRLAQPFLPLRVLVLPLAIASILSICNRLTS